ncbi:glycoside hydrolase family 38 C-terminal domain-containing protein [Cyanobium sp. ATX 6A2]|uniref:alpha-mannosidase n=1 Tax=Cyanobium sp. ATX 6A2 TaxID=2823700 RepID=UPI0020CCF0CE|nr:glycoside hydrolase family 38 C-terminal domain-containing protein [Cyanobium sp. ATX 6A2]
MGGRLELQPLWRRADPDGHAVVALEHPWGARHRPDWRARGLVIWPRGGQWCRLRLRLACPPAWLALQRQPRPQLQARLALRWWAECMELYVDGAPVHSGDLFDTSCRWRLPEDWWQGRPLQLELRLRSPRHDDGALIHSRLELEPLQAADPLGVLDPQRQHLRDLRRRAGLAEQPQAGAGFHVLGHAHLDLAWLWPVADTWQAAERTFASALDLMERFETLHFAHSTPALYAWLEQHRPALWSRLRRAVVAGRFEPINGPWVESDCVLISTASLLRQFQLGQRDSRERFPGLEHRLAWLPDSFGFAAGLPAVAAATGVRWFCTHKLFWNASNPFPHRLFRWRARCGAEQLALMTAPIGTDGDPLTMERQRLEWQQATGLGELLWLPGVGDHGGGPTAEMLEQLELWNQQPEAAPQRHGSLRAYLAGLEPHAPRLPVWRDELYLELHRGCATTRPDQKRHNRSLERLLRQAELAGVLAGMPPGAPVGLRSKPDWRPLLFQQFHDILPGTAIPEVFEQAEPQWRAARRSARRLRDQALATWLAGLDERADPGLADPGPAAAAGQLWWAVQLQPLAGPRPILRLPPGRWLSGQTPLPSQPAPEGGAWVQLPALGGVSAEPVWRQPGSSAHGAMPAVERAQALPRGAVWVDGRRAGNGAISVELGASGIEQLRDGQGRPLLAAALAWCRYVDRGEFWDAWDIAANYRSRPLPWRWQGEPQWRERGPLCASFVWRGSCGASRVRLDGRLLADSPWLELVLSIDWRQRHELLRLEVPLAERADRWASDTSGGVLERPAEPLTARERARWEVAAISWMASCGAGGDLAVLLDGPQGVSARGDRLGVSLLRAPTWPDPGADNGWQRLRLALLPCAPGWRAAAVPEQALAFREPPLLYRGGQATPEAGAVAARVALPALPPGVQLMGLRTLEPEGAVISLLNTSPCRLAVNLGCGWRIEARLDGMDESLAAKGGPLAAKEEQRAWADQRPSTLLLKPWELGFWRIAPADELLLISRRGRRRGR